MLAVPHTPFLPSIVRPFVAVRLLLIGRGHGSRRDLADLTTLFLRPPAPVSVVLSLGRNVEHPEAVRVLASQTRFVQERQQLGISSQLKTSSVAMHRRVLERNDGQMRGMIETSDAEAIAGGFLLRPRVVLADRIVQDKLGEQWIIWREVVCGVTVLALALVDGDRADGANSP
jgi:hypothetical protein